MYFANRCIGCGTCIKISQNQGVTAEEPGLRLHRNRQDNWEEIIYHCPTGAIAMDARTYTAQELINEAEKDRIFYRRGSGGVTLSGGEPLIPELTATKHNLAAIAEFLSGIYPEVHYELLNYNPLAEAKYHLVEREYCFKENPKMYTKAQMTAFGELVKEHGIKNLMMEID